MRCRNSGCKNKSKGPRFRFLCEKHLKLPRAEQNAALARLARRRMVGFDGRGRSLWRGSLTEAKDYDSRSPAFRILWSLVRTDFTHFPASRLNSSSSPVEALALSKK